MKQKEPAQTVRINPSTATAMPTCRVKDKPAVPGYRVWLISRDIDPDGSGCVPLSALQAAIAKTFGKRRLKKILQLGEGVFWHRYKSREGAVMVRYAGAARLAKRFGLACFNGSPVQIPSDYLYGSLVDFRAALQGVFDASRKDPRPITRKRRRLITGRCARTQRSYEEKIGTKVTRNIGIIDDYSIDKKRDALYEGQAAFKFVDHEGRIDNKPGSELLAKWLPNTYTPPATFQRVESRSSKRLSSQLKKIVPQDITSLLNKGQRVTSDVILEHGSKDQRVFYDAKEDKVVGDGYWMTKASIRCGIYYAVD